MSSGRVAWVWNLDADEELANVEGYASNVSEASAERVETYARKIEGFARPGDVLLTGRGARDACLAKALCIPVEEFDPAGYLGLAWCPTPSARSTFERYGVAVRETPSTEVLRTVNDRRFVEQAGATLLAGAAFVDSISEAEQVLRSRGEERDWLACQVFGFAGRGRLALRGLSPGRHLGQRERRFLESSLARDGAVLIQPRVEIDQEFGLHGWIDQTGEVLLGDAVVQSCDRRGAWQATERGSGELSGDDREALEVAARTSASALIRASFHGPFGIDAFRYSGGEFGFHAPSEINARFSMGWFVGMGPEFACHRAS